MDLSAIPEIRVEAAGDEMTYWLPARPLGGLRWLGLLPAGFSALWLAGIAHVLLPQLHPLPNHSQEGFDYLVGAFLLVFVVAGCAPAVLGLLIMFGQCRVRWRDGRLTVLDWAGPVWWRRRMPRSPLRKFLVTGSPASPGQRIGTASRFRLAALLAQFETGTPRIVAAGYPREWLEALAQDLSARMGSMQGASPQVEVFTALTTSPRAEDRPAEKPAGSQVSIQHGSASIVVEVPPLGLHKGSMGLFFMGCVWCLFMAIITAVMLFSDQAAKANDLELLLFLAGFWVVGLGLLVVAVYLGKRRATLTAGKSGLTVVQAWPFGVKRREFRRADIETVRMGFSNVRVNNRPLAELQIHRVGAKKVGFFVGREPDELRWMASELRKALGIAAEAQPVESSPTTPAAWPAGFQSGRNPGNKLVGLVVFAAMVVGFFWFFGHGFFARKGAHRAPPPAKMHFADSANPARPVPGLAFTAFGPSGTYGAHAWALGSRAHAEWFAAAASGRLTQLKLAIEPVGPGGQAGKATVFIARDRHGFPGATLEIFSVSAATRTNAGVAEPVVLESTKQPELTAGEKYWVCARSSGGWRWNYNDQNVVHNSARELRRHRWASAGDYCYVGAFSVMVSTNQPTLGAHQPAEEDPGK